MDLLLTMINNDIKDVKERIDNEIKEGSYKELFYGDDLKNADDVLELVNQWENLDDALSFDAGYIAGLSSIKRLLEGNK